MKWRKFHQAKRKQDESVEIVEKKGPRKECKGAKGVRQQCDVSASTLRGWATAGGQQRLGAVGGVSSSKQRADLRHQVDELKEACPGHSVITDVASGINLKKPGLRALLERVHKGMVPEVVVMHRDRAARFVIDLLEFVLRQQGCELLVHRRDEGSGERELAETQMEGRATSVAGHHGKRAAQERRKRKRRKRQEEEKARALEGQEDVQAAPRKKGSRLPAQG
ncbi:MAG: recombinase family protein [Gammaproteobacteria bacterium]|nr:recombinase family protein [Gammaproteobacteria bacterium]